MTTCGFELEVSAGARSVLASLREQGLTQHESLHGYHCGCDSCRPAGAGQGFRDGAEYLFKAQTDCTANGEFITSILEYGSPEMDRAITGLSYALLTTGAETSGNVGNHVHVGKDTLDSKSAARLCRLFRRYGPELAEIAAGPRGDMRNYNGGFTSLDAGTHRWNADGTRDSASLWEREEIDPDNDFCWYSDSLMCDKGGTVEFRLWNAVRAPWRIRTHVGLSVGMVEAAVAGADCTRDDRRCVEEVIGNNLDADTWAGVLRQRYSKGGLHVVSA